MLIATLNRIFGRKSKSRFRRSAYKPRVEMLENRQLLAAHIFTVDQNVAHHANFTTIQDAVNAAHAGDTIRVAPGIYDESVTVDKSLTIIGAQPYSSHTRRTDAAHETIVEAPDSSAGFDIAADKVTINGFTVRPQANATTDVVGISTSPTFSGAQILNNILNGDSVGIYLNSSGVRPTTVSGNAFLSNNFAGTNSGDAIFSDEGLLNASITGNFFSGDTDASIKFVGGNADLASLTAQSKVQILGNTITNDAPITVTNTSQLKIDGNVITNPSTNGIFLGGGVTQSEIVGNTIRGLATSSTGINLLLDTVDFPEVAVGANGAIGNSNIAIRGNNVFGFGDDGVRLDEGTLNVLVEANYLHGNGTGRSGTTGDGISVSNASSNIIRANTIIGNLRNGIFLSDAQSNSISANYIYQNGLDGIQLTNGSSNNTLSYNTVLKNKADGIRVDDTASIDNVIKYNVALLNAANDLFDATTGTGTAGTANTWKSNTAKHVNPAGLNHH